MGAAIDEAMARTDALLFGRRTWQGMAAAWPDQAGDPDADQMNAITKYVASRTLTPDDLYWNNSRLLPPDDAIGAIAELRDRDGGDLQVWGSASLVRTLISHDLLDEYRLMIEPVLLGGGGAHLHLPTGAVTAARRRDGSSAASRCLRPSGVRAIGLVQLASGPGTLQRP